jgi:hypothetical protein
MKRIIILAAALAVTPAAIAQLYKYVDKDGKTVYSDTPPANIDSKQISVPGGKAAVPSAATAAPKSAVERDKELDKSRDEAREKQKKAADVERKSAEAEARCSQAKSAYATYAEGGRIHKYNDKGEREYLGDVEIEEGRVRTRREMDEACKKP